MRKHVYNMETCLFLYKTIVSEHMFIPLVLLYLAGSSTMLTTVKDNGVVCSALYNYTSLLVQIVCGLAVQGYK